MNSSSFTGLHCNWKIWRRSDFCVKTLALRKSRLLFFPDFLSECCFCCRSNTWMLWSSDMSAAARNRLFELNARALIDRLPEGACIVNSNCAVSAHQTKIHGLYPTCPVATHLRSLESVRLTISSVWWFLICSFELRPPDTCDESLRSSPPPKIVCVRFLGSRIMPKVAAT